MRMGKERGACAQGANHQLKLRSRGPAYTWSLTQTCPLALWSHSKQTSRPLSGNVLAFLGDGCFWVADRQMHRAQASSRG